MRHWLKWAILFALPTILICGADRTELPVDSWEVELYGMEIMGESLTYSFTTAEVVIVPPIDNTPKRGRGWGKGGRR